jgi:hypothetical protein
MSFESFSNLHELDSKEKLFEDIKRQFNEEAISDFTIIAEDRKIFVSKVIAPSLSSCPSLCLSLSLSVSVSLTQFILYSRSEYFRALLSSKMEEAESGVVSIEDFSYEAVFEMVRFLYSGSCNMNPVSALPALFSSHLCCPTGDRPSAPRDWDEILSPRPRDECRDLPCD